MIRRALLVAGILFALLAPTAWADSDHGRGRGRGQTGGGERNEREDRTFVSRVPGGFVVSRENGGLFIVRAPGGLFIVRAPGGFVVNLTHGRSFVSQTNTGLVGRLASGRGS